MTTRLRILCVLVSVCVSVSTANARPKSTKNPRFDAAVDKALTWLNKDLATREPDGGIQVLAAYALLKCDEPPSNPHITSAVRAILGRTNSGVYRPTNQYEHLYIAGVDAMLLSDVDAKAYQPQLQVIANYIQSTQRADGSWSDLPSKPGDISMCQYAMLGLWAAQRAGCQINPQVVEKAADFHLRNSNGDGGWCYRPGTTEGPGNGNSTHNMTMAGAGSVSIARFLLHGQKAKEKKEATEAEKKFGLLEKVDPLAEMTSGAPIGAAFNDFKPGISSGALDDRIGRALSWNDARFTPVSRVEHNLYFYYCLERAVAINSIERLGGQDWFLAYGEGLLTLQSEDGSFPTYSGPVTGTAFALLFFMRSTQQIIDKQYGLGLQRGNRGNPFGDKKKERDPTPLDQLLSSIESQDFESIAKEEVSVADQLVLSIQSIKDPEELVGQVDRLKTLVNHPEPDVRQPVYWALGRSGDFGLIPLLIKGLRDPNIDVAAESEQALRYIARKPQGVGLPDTPLAGFKGTSDEDRLKHVNLWRDRATRAWSNWYSEMRPYEERDGLEQLEVLIPGGNDAKEKP